MSRWALFTTASLSVQIAASVTLATFDGSPRTTFDFKELNDPVMGGRSRGTFTVDSKGKFGVFDGEVVDVPSLKAPGFIKFAADGKFPDASVDAAGALVLTVRTTTPDFKGFRVSFASGAMSPPYACAGGGTIPFSRGCFKAKFSVPAGDDFQTIRIPFNDFSDRWSPATGEQTKTCAEEKDACPTAKKLAAIQRIELWAEGALGKVHLEIQSISAETSAPSASLDLKMQSDDITLLNFEDSEKAPKFTELNDPVMGGRSVGTVTVNSTGHFLVFDGTVVDVPALKAPGFIETHADGKYPDISAAAGGGLVLTVRSHPEYTGWKLSLASGALSPTFACAGGGGLPFSRGCYKAPFTLPAGGDFVQVYVPFSSFTDRWSSTTGQPVASCEQDSSTCLTARKLKSIQRVELMAEGVAGKVHLEVKSIVATSRSGIRSGLKEASTWLLPAAGLSTGAAQLVV